MSVIGSNILAGASGQAGYNLTKSLRFRRSASGYLNRTPASASNRTTWTWSGWVKLGLLDVSRQIFGTEGGATQSGLVFESANTLFAFSENASETFLRTTQVFRDPSAWYHVVWAEDTTQATASNRSKLYINGVQITAFSTANYPSPSFNGSINNNVQHLISSYDGVNQLYDGYMTEINFVDGQQLTPSSFGETSTTTGVWIPKKYTGTYGTNGFYLPFTDNSALTTSSNAGLGKDFSGNANYFATNGISITSGSTYDSMTDVPTLTSATTANYCVLNPLNKGSAITLLNANLGLTQTSTWNGVTGTFGVSSGKWYFELIYGGGTACVIGVATSSYDITTEPGDASTAWRYRSDDGTKKNGGSSSAYGATWTTNNVIGVAVDMDSGTITFYKDNASQGEAFSNLSGNTVFPVVGIFSSSGTTSLNFGQQPFSYTPPSGFVALNTFNISAGTITTSGSFTGNTATDGPFIYLNGVPTAMTINGNSVTFGTDADKLSNGFKVRSSSSSYNASGSNTYSISTTSDKFKFANAQPNP